MIARGPLNTKTLQATFPEVYRRFFVPCQRVASASHSFLWAGEFSGFYDGLMLAQKLPLRLYIGFEFTTDGQISIDRQYEAYSVSAQKFETCTIDSRLSDILTDYLTQHFANLDDFTGLKVKFLAEVPFGHSLGSHGAIASAVALLLSNSDNVMSCYPQAQTILAAIQSGHTSGVSAYLALANTASPVVFAHKTSGFWAKPLHELIKHEKLPAWPFDFALIYTGAQVNTESVVRASATSTAELDAIAHGVSGLLHDQTERHYTKTYMEMLNMTCGICIYSMSELFHKGPSRDRLEAFFNGLNQYQNMLLLLDVSTPIIDNLYSAIHAMANKQQNEVGSGVKVSGVGKGGVMVCALPYGTYRDSIFTVISQTSVLTGASICLDYASWIDGHDVEGGKIDQDLAKDHFSAFVSRDTVTIRQYHNGSIHLAMLTPEQLKHEIDKYDLLLDTVSGKVKVGGQVLTSKELPSQKATVIILSQLLQSANLMLANTDIDDSYGSNRYDLHGKIVIPLVKQIKQITGRDLNLTIKGDMYDHYELTIKPNNLLIGVIEEKK